MFELNVEFLEQYKKLDKLCKDMYPDSEWSSGVTSYIKEMEGISFLEQLNVPNWIEIYNKLKHFRWMRNQLAHEIDIESDFCKQEDINWLNNFYEDLLNCKDPLAILENLRQTKKVKSIVEEDSGTIFDNLKDVWRKFKSKIKNLFK